MGRDEEERLFQIAKNHTLKNENLLKEKYETDLINLF